MELDLPGAPLAWSAAWLERGEGHGPGPRVRPRRDRWRLDPALVTLARDQGLLPLGYAPARLGVVDAPRVLVTMDVDAQGPVVGDAYVAAVARAGGTPWLLPSGPADPGALLDAADAVVVTGGAFDIHPRHYGREVQGRLDRVDEDRTGLELALCRAALDRGVPVLGVCGGLQALAVAAGGTLILDLPSEPSHEQPTDPAEPWHAVALDAPMADWLGPEVQVNSTHHQAVDDPGDLTVVGRSPEGVVEAARAPLHPFAVGVQWHPELLGDDRLYRRLVLAAAARCRSC
ncbi:MAG: gamma-glutamyl-gamma-aminobutyrate hydrolase family protein [Alphaproteobacteria bacterium]|nr:gamma-glutamyl-gamma-aminobutyrate hydrolase family protein [Alphaproteobacteria bacterium]